MVTEKEASDITCLDLPSGTFHRSLSCLPAFLPSFLPRRHLRQQLYSSRKLVQGSRRISCSSHKCRAHLYFVSARKSGIRGKHEMRAILLNREGKTPSSRCSTLRAPSTLPHVQHNRPEPFSVDPRFATNCEGGDQWMQRSDTFRQYITINYTCIGKLIYYDY